MTCILNMHLVREIALSYTKAIRANPGWKWYPDLTADEHGNQVNLDDLRFGLQDDGYSLQCMRQ